MKGAPSSSWPEEIWRCLLGGCDVGLLGLDYSASLTRIQSICGEHGHVWAPWQAGDGLWHARDCDLCGLCGVSRNEWEGEYGLIWTGGAMVVEGKDDYHVDGNAVIDRQSTTAARRRGVSPVRERAPLVGDPLGRVPRRNLYVLFREPGAGRLPFVLAWISRHQLTSGYSQAHAARFKRVLVIGQPDGLLLPQACDTSFVNAEHADTLFRLGPTVGSFFGKDNGL